MVANSSVAADNIQAQKQAAEEGSALSSWNCHGRDKTAPGSLLQITLRTSIEEQQPQAKNTLDKFKDQVDAYKTGLVQSLNYELAETDIKLTQSMSGLADQFEARYATMDNISVLMNRDISSEQLSVTTDHSETEERFTLGEYMHKFQNACGVYKTRIGELWDEYEQTQKRIMELALVMCYDCDNGVCDPILNEEKIARERDRYDKIYSDAIDDLDSSEALLCTKMDDALTENDKLLKALHAETTDLKKKLSGCLSTKS